jgi:hypothetical protein
MTQRGYSKKDGLWVPDPMDYHPIRKHLHFDPCPVAGNIPFYADAKKNPRCVDTTAFTDFWDEQFDRCVNGYETGGIWIPGRYYYFLNFAIIDGVLGKQYPWYLDIQLEFFRTVEYVKQEHKLGIVIPKARRRGVTEMIEFGIMGHGLRFIEGYKGAVAAGDNKYITVFRNKFDKSAGEIRDELKLNIIADNKDEYKIGYEIYNAVNQKEEAGFGGMLKFASMYDKATKLEGEYFHDVDCEESGQFSFLLDTVESIKPALMMGSVTKGTFYLGGSVGNILTSSRGFKMAWDEAEKFDLVPFYISGRRMLYPFIGLSSATMERHNASAVKEDDKLVSDLPNLSKLGWQPHELVGCEDIAASEKWILDKTEEYSKLPNKKNLIKHKQNFPITVQDAFTSGGSNDFNTGLLMMQKHEIYKNTDDRFTPGDYILEFEKTKDNYGLDVIKSPLKVSMRIATPTDKEWEKVRILEPPLKTRKSKMDHAGVDAYEMDDSETTTSLGGICVLRDSRVSGYQGIMHRPGIYPIACYYKRPPRKEYFFEICLKIAVLYNTRRRTMISAEHESCIDFFKKNYGEKYLAFRPKALDSPKSKMVHKYGTKMTPYSKPRFLSIMQTWIEDYFDLIWFEELIDDYLTYDKENMGNDWDLADACGNALTSILKKNASGEQADFADEGDDDEDEKEYQKFRNLPTYGYDRRGNFVTDMSKVTIVQDQKPKETGPDREHRGTDFIRC